MTAPYVLVAYSKAILQLQFGAGAAVTLVMLPIIGGLVFVLVRLLRPRTPARAWTGRRDRRGRRCRGSSPWRSPVLAWASPQIFWKAAVVLG